MTTDMKKVIETAASNLELAAKHFKDKGATAYTAELHASACGYALAKALKDGMEPTSTNLGALFHAVYNQSAWRQKFEKAKLFPKKEERSLDTLVNDLEKEMDGEEEPSE